MTRIDEIKKLLQAISREHRIDEPRSFLFWFMKAQFYLRDPDIKACICDAKNDKTIDAIYIDAQYDLVYVIQSKYNLDWHGPKFHKADLTVFSNVRKFFDRENKKNEVYVNANQSTRARLEEAYRRVKKGCSLRMIFVTNRPDNEKARNELITTEDLDALEFRVFTRPAILALYEKYIRGAVPPIPREHIRVVEKQSFDRDDKVLGLRSFAFTTKTSELARMYKRHGERLFERNVREFIKGSSKVNNAIRKTLQSPSQVPWFWYYHNGVTFLADWAKLGTDEEGWVMEADNPQIVNGLQSTRIIASSHYTKADVACRLIVLGQTEDNYETIQRIIRAANSQNPVSEADLMSNDARQVKLQRALDAHGYFYERKQNEWANTPKTLVEKQSYKENFDKITLARVMVSTERDPREAKGGKNKLFSSPLYERAFADRFEVDDYLFRWWLFVACRSRIRRGERVAKQASLHVLSSLFDRLLPIYTKRRLRRGFVELMETASAWPPMPLRRAVDEMFNASRLLLKKERKKDPEVDANYLFKTEGTKRKLESLLRSQTSMSAKISREMVSLRKAILRLQ